MNAKHPLTCALFAAVALAALAGCRHGQGASPVGEPDHRTAGATGVYSIALDGRRVLRLHIRGYVVGRGPADGSILFAPSYERLAVMSDDGSERRTLFRLHDDRLFSLTQSPWSPD